MTLEPSSIAHVVYLLSVLERAEGGIAALGFCVLIPGSHMVKGELTSTSRPLISKSVQLHMCGLQHTHTGLYTCAYIYVHTQRDMVLCIHVHAHTCENQQISNI